MSEGQVPITQLSIQDLGSLKQIFEIVSLLLKFNTTFPSDDVLLVLVFFIFFFFINAGRETFYISFKKKNNKMMTIPFSNKTLPFSFISFFTSLVTKQMQEIQQLMGNYQSLRVAQSQFGSSKASIASFKSSTEGAEMLIPLTEALYVPATVASNKKVLVEYGAGYFVERDCEDAEAFFNRKVKFLTERTSQLEMTIRQKREQLAQVIQIYQMK